MFVIASCILIGVIYSTSASTALEKRIENLEKQLEYGGKNYQSISYSK